MKKLFFLICMCVMSVCQAQVTFKAVSSTIRDAEGLHTNSNFETPAMTVTDNANSVGVYWGGTRVTLNSAGNGMFSASQTVNGKNISLTAYRSGGKTSQVVTSLKSGIEQVTIYFKPASVTTSSTQGSVISVNSTTIHTSTHAWYVTKVQLNGLGTQVTKVCRPKTENTWIQNSGSEFIEDCATGKRYYLQSSSIAMAPQKTILILQEPKVFYEYYPALPASVKTINISSGSQYYVKNLRIR